jgi:hypothetical protein
MKVPSLSKKDAAPKVLEKGVLFKQMPSWWVTLFAYVLAGLFCYFNHRFFLWFPPYLLEVFKNLRGLPAAWADLGLFWAERGLACTAVIAALYHQAWQVGTRYVLTEHEIRIESWFPFRKVVSIPLAAVRRYSFQQNWFAVLFNFGIVEIDTASQSSVILPNCPEPLVFLDKLKPWVAAHLYKSRLSNSHGAE